MNQLTEKQADFTDDVSFDHFSKSKMHKAAQMQKPKSGGTRNNSIKGADNASVSKKRIFSVTVVPRKRKSKS